MKNMKKKLTKKKMRLSDFYSNQLKKNFTMRKNWHVYAEEGIHMGVT